MLRTRLLCPVLATAALTLPGAAAATPLLVQDERGDTSLLWGVLQQTHRPLLATSAASDGVFGPLTELGTPGNTYGGGAPLVAADERGGAVATWAASVHAATYDYPAVFVSIKPRGGSFGEPEQISAPGAHTGELALDVNARGDAVATWIDYAAGGIVYSLRPADGQFGEPQPLPGPITHDLHVVLEADGGALFLGSGTPPDPYATYRRPDGTFADAAPLADVSLFSAAVVANKRGDVLLAWAENADVKVRERPAGGVFGATRTIGQGASPDHYQPPLDGVMNDAGDAVVTVANGPVVTALTRSGSGGAFAAQTIGMAAYDTSVAMNDRGDAAIVFALGPRWLAAAYRRPGGGFAPAGIIGTALSGRPALGIDGTGSATAVWEDSDGENVTLRVRRFIDDQVVKAPDIATVPTFVQEQPPEACTPNGATVVKRGSRAVITIEPTLGFKGCLLARGTPVGLGRLYRYGAGSLTDIQGPPRVALRGPFAAAVVASFSHNSSASYISVVDLRDELSDMTTVAPAVAGFESAPVPALKLAPSGAAAWVACSPLRRKDGRPPGSCTARGRSLKQVYVVPAGSGFVTSARRVGAGQRIDPASLRVSAGRVSWRDGTRHRSVPLG